MEKELREFDSTGEWFAHVTPDNRLRVIYYFFEKKKKKQKLRWIFFLLTFLPFFKKKVWNTIGFGGNLKTEFASQNHLNEKVTCLSWGQISVEDLQVIL